MQKPHQKILFLAKVTNFLIFGLQSNYYIFFLIELLYACELKRAINNRVQKVHSFGHMAGT